MTVERSLRLSDPDAVPLARRFVGRLLEGTPEADLAQDAELVTAELATNALIHAGPPVTLRVVVSEGRVRLEVLDDSRSAPVRGVMLPDGMTGRGLAVVQAVSSRWGIDPRNGGKVVWAELAAKVLHQAPLHAEVDALLDQWPDLEQPGASEPRYTIDLGEVPTNLLLSAKAHVDNLVREFTLVSSSGPAAGPGDPHLAALIETVTHQFAEARQAIKRQAVEAAGAGRPRTRIRLTLPERAADEGLDYLAALDESDAYARAARLLTLETPPQHRAFRRWYITSLVRQLRAAARGEVPGPIPTFEQYLLDEYAVVAAAERAADRSSRLHDVTASLAGAVTVGEVGQAVVSQSVRALRASGGVLIVVEGDRLTAPGVVGYDARVVELLKAESLDAQLPAAVALQTSKPVWVESREERDAWFPELADLEPSTVSMCAVPVAFAGRTRGVLRFSFDTPRLFDETERKFVLAVAAQTAQALDRAHLVVAERSTRARAEVAVERLARYHDVTAALAAATHVNEIADIVTTQAARLLGAEVSVVSVLDEDDPTLLRVLGLHGAQPATQERWSSFPVDADLPASEAMRTNRPVVARNRAEMEARYPALAGQILFERSLVCVPLSAGAQPLGVLSLMFPPEHLIDDAEIALLTTIGRQCTLALERARLLAAEREARDRSTFLADATRRLTSSLEPAETLKHLTGLVVPAFADWSVVYLADAVGQVSAVSAAHRDPEVGQRLLQLMKGRPLDVAAPGGLGEVLRTGKSVRYGRVPDQIRARVGEYLDERISAALMPRSGVGVPLVARGRVIGALGLVRTDGEPYTDADLQIVEEIAARAAVAVDHAKQFDREREAALTLQRSLLPQQLPRIEGVSLAWRYLPGSAGTHIGGDWYDVIPLEEGRVALVIGDVMGRGLRAAALMGQMRATARAHASAQVGPAEVLARLDTALGRLEQDQIITVLFGVLDPHAGSLTLASAGHLPPLVTTGGGAAHYLDVEPGPPLGTGEAKFPELHAQLPEGATLLLFTDGLVESRNLPIDRGLEVLLMAAASDGSPEELCERALAALGRDTAHEDDTAVLAVALPASRES